MDKVIQRKKPYAKPLLKRVTLSGIAAQANRSAAGQEMAGEALAVAAIENILLIEGYRSDLLDVAPPLQRVGFSLGWSPASGGQQFLMIRLAKKDGGSPADESILADLRFSADRLDALLEWITRTHGVSPLLVGLLLRPEEFAQVSTRLPATGIWQSKHSLGPMDLATLLESFLGVCAALKKSRLVEGIVRHPIR
jgi:hypothetical protein